MEEKKYDLVVIGTGDAGKKAAFICAEAGWKVAIVDARPFGGTCALRGCVPKKVLVGGAELADFIRRMQGKGIKVKDDRLDWPALMRFKRTFTTASPSANEAGFAKAGIDAYRGQARFTAKTTIRVGEELVLTGRFVHIATGSKPRQLGIPGEELVTLSDQFLDLDLLPARIIFIGGGYISFEFAHLAARAGSRVTILHRSEPVLKQFVPTW